MLVLETVPYDVRKYQEFCNIFNLKQRISRPTRITSSGSTIIDHILASYRDSVSQKGKLEKRLTLRQCPINKSVSAH